MNKFEQHLMPEKTLTLKRKNGEEDVFTIQPLPYKFVPKVFRLFNKLKDFDKIDEEDTSAFFEAFDEETITLLQELILESLKISYPEEKVETLESFASANLFNLTPVILEVNSFNIDTDSIEFKKKIAQMEKLKKDAGNK